MPDPIYQALGTCPICEGPAVFAASDAWYRDQLVCLRCESIPRERAVALLLDEQVPSWRDARIHESSFGDRAFSRRLSSACPAYLGTQYFPGHKPGAFVAGIRNEDLQAQTFPDSCFDLVLTLDVMEHVFRPDLACAEIARTLVPGGRYIFSVPTFAGQLQTVPRAREEAGTVLHLAPPEYHGNPVDPNGSLVTFHYGYDLAADITAWSGLDVRVTRFHDAAHAILGAFTEVYVCRKPFPLPPGPPLEPATPETFSERHYLAANPDVVNVLSGTGPGYGTRHFLGAGQFESRKQLRRDTPDHLVPRRVRQDQAAAKPHAPATRAGVAGSGTVVAPPGDAMRNTPEPEL